MVLLFQINFLCGGRKIHHVHVDPRSNEKNTAEYEEHEHQRQLIEAII